MARVKASDIEGIARAVLWKFFPEDLNPDVGNVVSSLEKKVILTALPRVFVESFVVEYMAVDRVIGMEIEVDGDGRATGFVVKSEVLADLNKEDTIKEFAGDFMADVGVGKYKSTRHFLSVYKEAYVVRSSCKSQSLPKYKLPKPIIFHDVRLVPRPNPLKS